MTETKKRNQYQFDKYKYDHIHLQVPKGKKESIQCHAGQVESSVNKFINRAIDEAIDRDRLSDDTVLAEMIEAYSSLRDEDKVMVYNFAMRLIPSG